MKDNDLKLICLACRYNLDILYDLKKLYQETFDNLKGLLNKKIDYSIFPKVRTYYCMYCLLLFFLSTFINVFFVSFVFML